MKITRVTTTTEEVNITELFRRYEKNQSYLDRELIAELIKWYRGELDIQLPYKIILRHYNGHLSIRNADGLIEWSELKKRLTAVVSDSFEFKL